MRGRLKKLKSDKKKSFLVFIIFFALLGFCFYKNLESNLKGFYASRNYHGSVQITGFSWERENDAPDVNYVYTEKINGKEISIPLKKPVQFKHMVMPYFDQLDNPNNKGIISGLTSFYDEDSRPYFPIIEKALDINPERKPLETELQDKIHQASELKETTIQLKESLSDGYLSAKSIFWYTVYEKQSIEEKRTKLAGWYGFSLKDALKTGAIYVQIELPKQIDRLDSLDINLPEQLKQLLQKTELPDGYYSLAIKGERVGKIVQIRNGKVENWI